jgi:threonine aldolase
MPSLVEVRGALARRNAAEYPVRLVWLENTHNVGGGAVATPREMAELRGLVADQGVAVHVDGARVFNAAAALGLPVAALVEHVDSISVGFNKGLACPAGCVLVGSAALIESARDLRRMLGGRLTKAGVLAAACLVALDTMVARLADDHAVARQFAAAVETIPGLRLESPVATNIIRFDCGYLAPASRFVAALAEQGVRAGAVGETVIRAVTHHHITPETMTDAIAALRATASTFARDPAPALAG